MLCHQVTNHGVYSLVHMYVNKWLSVYGMLNNIHLKEWQGYHGICLVLMTPLVSGISLKTTCTITHLYIYVNVNV